jgi:hypothetical protein
MKSNIISSWATDNRKQYKSGKLSEDKLQKLMAINFTFDAVRTGRTDSWHSRLEEWQKGMRNPLLQQWKQRNIQRYVAGKLPSDKIVKLKAVGILK